MTAGCSRQLALKRKAVHEQSCTCLAACNLVVPRYSVGLCTHAGIVVDKEEPFPPPKMVAVPFKTPDPPARKGRKKKTAARQLQGPKLSVLDSTVAAATTAGGQSVAAASVAHAALSDPACQTHARL